MDETLWRSSLAEIAFPDLKVRAAKFRAWLQGINIFVVAWLIATCILSWNVTLGNSALADYAAAQARFEAAQKAVNDLEAGRITALATEGGAKTEETAAEGVEAAPAPPATAAPAKMEKEVGYCERWRLNEPGRAHEQNGGQLLRQYDSADQRQACNELAAAERQLETAAKRPSGWVWISGAS